ncbi:MAG: lamin tail domain-containing protein [Verrucomicrobiota bacterium]
MSLSTVRLLFALIAFTAVFPASGAVRISEFLASNLRGMTDEDGNHEDWIELFNDGGSAVSLDGWYLTDNASDLTKWRFPNTNIGSGQFLVVFASDKDRRSPGTPLHTNFKLSDAGEYLALVQPNGTTIATQFAPKYPAQVTDVSYGFPALQTLTVLAQGSPVKWKVWTNATDFNTQSPGWNSNLNYATTVWSNGTSGLGWDDNATPVDFTSYFGNNANPRSLITGQSRALFARFLPVLTNVASAAGLKLRMRFDDGFVAWLNGTLVASNLAPATPSWDSLATGTRDDSLNAAWASFDLPLAAAVEGTNLLAIQAFNTTATSSDLLLLPELDLLRPNVSTTAAYLNVPTPGSANGTGSSSVPPSVELPTQPGRPLGGPTSPSITITALVTQTLFPITNVTLYHRVMFSNEVAVTMTAGTGGLYTASIPTTGLNAGQMLRWRIEAKDSSTNTGTAPRFLDANDDDRYTGTLALNSGETNSLLPIVHLFVENYGAISAESGGRCSLYYLDRFYDNIFAKLHGQSTSAFPKKSHDLDFNAGNRFKWREGEKEAKDINLLSNWADKSKVRNTLAYEMFNRAGLLAHWAFPVRVQSNGVFHAIADMVEDGDDRYLERVGLDPNGALYKVYDSYSGTSTWSVEKKSRKQEGNTDLADFNAGIANMLTAAQRRAYVYDNVNIAASINYFAAVVINSCTDQGHKNFYLYRDSDGTREWRILPWDADLTFGHDWLSGPGYFDDNIYVNQPLQLGIFNTFKDVIFNNAELNQIFLRRLRTLMDDVLQPGTTPVNLRTNENRIAELLNLMDPPGVATSDADQDFTNWGWWTNSTRQVSVNPAQEIRPQAQRIIDNYLPGRRSFLTSGPTSSGGFIPISQSTNANVAVEIGDFNPAGGNQAQEYVRLRNTNSFAVDLSSWKLSSAIDYTFPPGTVIPSGSGISGNVGLLFVAKDPYAFRQRTVAPTSNQFCLVSGPYSGQLSARGETVVLTDKLGRTINSAMYAGAPSLAQQFLRITELMYNPAPLNGATNDAQEFEFIELRNISPTTTLNLQGVRFTNGITFAFTNSTLLGPQQSLILTRNPTAFAQRYGNGFTVAGPFTGYLDNGGERLTLIDAVSEEILDFSYNNSWYPITDGLGFSLVVVNEAAAPDAWDSKANWRASGTLHGSPGAADTLTPFAAIKVNEVLAHTDLPQVDSIELFNPTTNVVNLGGWFITDDFLTPKKYRIPNGTTIPPRGYVVFDENQFNNQPVATNNFRLSSTGDDVWLFSGDANTNLTGYYHGAEFGASANGSSFGRHLTSVGEEHFVVQRALTLGTNNAGPLVGPVIIRAIMYHPPDAISNSIATDDDLNEFIELLNPGSTNVPLFSTIAPTNTWRLRDAVDFSFPTNVTLAAGSNVFVVGFNPTNAAQLAAFRAKWNLSASTPVFGPWSGKLDNSADDVKLERPDAPNLDGSVPFILVERVQYVDTAPWPSGADGFGAALQRNSYADFANDPAYWHALPPQGATMPDTDGDGMADWWEANHGLNPLLNDAVLDSDGDGLSNQQEFIARTNPNDAASALRLQVENISSGGVRLNFEAQPQISYAVQTNSSLTPGGWQIWQQIAAAPTNRSVVLTTPTAGGLQFYRVRTPAN